MDHCVSTAGWTNGRTVAKPSSRPAPDAPSATKEPAASVTAYPDGPLVLRGDFVVKDVNGRPVDTGRIVALCRCGRSATKPLCDGNHKNKRGALSDAVEPQPD